MPDGTGAAAPEWTKRLQSLVDETVARSTLSTANFERLLAAATRSGVDQESWANELTRVGTEHGPEAYRQLAAVTTRFTAESLRLVAAYLEAYLRDLVPDGRVGRIGSPPSMPVAPESADTSAWTAWYQGYGIWVSEQQAWSARLLTVIREEVAAGRLPADALQSAARGFLERRLPDHLIAMAELNTDLVSDVLRITDDSLERLADAMIGDDTGDAGGDAFVIDVRGVIATAVAVSLVVENSRPEAAVITCDSAPTDGFGLTLTPEQFSLRPDQSRPVTINVDLPSRPTHGPAEAGTVTIRGQDEQDLVVWIRAQVDPPPETPPMMAASVVAEQPEPQPEPTAERDQGDTSR